MIQSNGKIPFLLKELILLKWPYYLKLSTDSVLSLSKYHIFHRTRNKNSKIPMKTQKPYLPKNFWEKKKKWKC